MVKNIVLAVSEDYYPYRNQAIERCLMDVVDNENETVIMYLWGNDKTVVIGKNQNAYSECNISALEKDGGFLTRRISGGGAVYHDKGNLNFTFIAGKQNYSLQRQFTVMTEAVRSLGINAELSGRNDVTVNGKKFSGNAFYHAKDVSIHHGTILIKSAYESIEKYLMVSKIKLLAKGVKSVPARIVNLSEYNPDINRKVMVNAMTESFKNEYKEAQFTKMDISSLNKESIYTRTAYFEDRKRYLGDDIYYNAEIEKRFDWGTADIRVELRDGIITKAKIYTDSLDTDIALHKERELIGKSLYENKNSEVEDIIKAIGDKYEI